VGKGARGVHWERGGGLESEREGGGGDLGSFSQPSNTAGIRQAYPLFNKEQHMKWNRDELRGLTYLHTDKGPQKAWLFKIGRASSPRCKCGETQNAAHLLTSGCVGGMRRTWDEMWTDRVFCEAVTNFLREGSQSRE